MTTPINFELKTAGYCLASRHHSLHGSPKEVIRFYASYGLLKHPSKGYILFDTGYTRRFYELTKTYPGKLYAQITKVFIEQHQEAKIALAKQGIQATEINYIVISHFHADHIGGLMDFPNATFICSKAAWDDFRPRRGFQAVRKGYLPGLIPNDFQSRLELVDFKHPHRSDPHLGGLIDIFEDGSIFLCSLEGHAKGQMGALFQGSSYPVFLLADAAWHKEAFEEKWLPNPIVRLFFDNWLSYKKSLEKVHNYYKANPGTVIIPSHCNKTRLQYGTDR